MLNSPNGLSHPPNGILPFMLDHGADEEDVVDGVRPQLPSQPQEDAVEVVDVEEDFYGDKPMVDDVDVMRDEIERQEMLFDHYEGKKTT